MKWPWFAKVESAETELAPRTTDDWLLKEAENAAALTYHIDELRNRLTSFFVGLAGILVTAVSFLREEAELEIPTLVGGVLLLVLAGLGFVIIRILGRLRAVQLEHFAVIANIRDIFLAGRPERDLIGLSADTLPPRNNRGSGTYFWTLLIIILSALSATAGAYVLLVEYWSLVSAACGAAAMPVTVALAWFLLDMWWVNSLGDESPAEKLALARKRG